MHFRQYKRVAVQEMARWVSGMDMTGVSIAEVDRANGSPMDGDMIARNPKNHADKWLVAAKYFAENGYTLMDAEPARRDLAQEERLANLPNGGLQIP